MSQQLVLVEIISEGGLESLLRNPQIRVVGVVAEVSAPRMTTSEAGQWTTVPPTGGDTPPEPVPSPS